MFEHLCGKTTVPNSSKGSIVKKLVGFQKLPVVNFLSIDCQIGINVLIKDQQYLLVISKAIILGTCKEDLVVRDPGHISH